MDVQYKTRIEYRDPGHDDAFVGLRTNSGHLPADLPEALTLAPQKALPGIEIHRVSNESGLRGNIGQGFIGRADCNPPELKDGEYRNCGTEYIALSMITQGGSSGSVAVDIRGDGVGVTCSGNDLDCFMLPVDLPLRALQKLEQGKFVTRGTLQTRWVLKSINECRTLVLAKTWLERFQAEGVRHLVCAAVVLTDGPTDGKVEVGDLW